MNIYDKAELNLSDKTKSLIDEIADYFKLLHSNKENNFEYYDGKKKLRDLIIEKYNLSIVKDAGMRIVQFSEEVAKQNNIDFRDSLKVLDSASLFIQEKELEIEIKMCVTLEFNIKKIIGLSNNKEVNVIIKKIINSKLEEHPIIYIWDNYPKEENLSPDHFILKFNFNNHVLFKNSNISFLFEDSDFEKQQCREIVEFCFSHISNNKTKEIKELLNLTHDKKISYDLEVILKYLDNIKNYKYKNTIGDKIEYI